MSWAYSWRSSSVGAACAGASGISIACSWLKKMVSIAACGPITRIEAHARASLCSGSKAGPAIA